jgi:hypothetical protein
MFLIAKNFKLGFLEDEMDTKNNKVLEEVKKKISEGNGGNGSDNADDIASLKLQFEVKDDDLEDLKAQAKKRSQEVHVSAGDYYRMTKRIKALEDISGIELLPEKAKEMVQLRTEKNRIDQNLLHQAQAIRDQFAINVLIAEINDYQPTCGADVLRFFYLLLNGGSLDNTNLQIHKRLQRPNRENQETLFFYDDKSARHDFARIPSQLEGRKGQISGTDKVLVASLRGLIKRYVSLKENQKEAELRKEDEKFEVIKSQIATSECDIRDILDGKPGTYIFFLPARMEGERKFGQDGAGIVRVKNLNKPDEKEFWVIWAVDGAGSLKCLARNSGHWVALSTLRHYAKFSELPDRVPDNRREITLLLCRKLYAAYCANRRQRRQ